MPVRRVTLATIDCDLKTCAEGAPSSPSTREPSPRSVQSLRSDASEALGACEAASGVAASPALRRGGRSATLPRQTGRAVDEFFRDVERRFSSPSSSTGSSASSSALLPASPTALRVDGLSSPTTAAGSPARSLRRLTRQASATACFAGGASGGLDLDFKEEEEAEALSPSARRPRRPAISVPGFKMEGSSPSSPAASRRASGASPSSNGEVAALSHGIALSLR
eukprot:TRINITY_DN10024_c0_g1_i1.p1 TRINITY_DN10024_c0_g1~~TRINITY_DN10024_c0_g1_i1.p1  ORF type:complete len:252 (+),score=43.26 TRINITY_DN10024_c0_g1_i1:85-756(+)